MEVEDLAKLITTRRSIRRWQDKEVPESLLTQAIEMATWAPNGGNEQNWHFHVIVNRDTIKAIADAVQANADLIASWEEADSVGYAASGRHKRASFFREAPAAIMVSSSQYQSPVDKILAAREKTDPRAHEMRQWRNIADSRIQSVASAIAYLLLILHTMGLGAVWMTGPIHAKAPIEKILGIPPHMDIIAFLPVGYPAEVPVSKGRRPVTDVCDVVR